MAPNPGGTQKATTTTKKNAYNGIGKAEPAMPTINYEEVQSNEVEVLQSIFAHDYQQVELKSAWSKTTDRAFKLQIRATLDPEVFVTLNVRLTATYPKTAPLLSVDGLKQHHERTQSRIQTIITERLPQLLGEVMIYEIASEITEALDDGVRSKEQGVLPSLDAERATAQQASTLLAKQAEEAEARKLQHAKSEEERVTKERVEAMMHRRASGNLVKTHSHVDAESGLEIIDFSQSATLLGNSGTVTFSKVQPISLLDKTLDARVYLARPSTLAPCSTLVCVKRSKVHKAAEEIMELEDRLQTLQKLRHPGISGVLAFRIDQLENAKSEVIIASEYAGRNRLHDLLDISTLHVAKARQITIEMLDALDFLHTSGVVHGNLSAESVVIATAPTLTAKLTDFGYPTGFQRRNTLSTNWRAPDCDQPSNSTLQKSDLWDLGVVVAQLFLGLDIVTTYMSPTSMLSILDCSPSFADFIRKLLSTDPKKRPSAFDMLAALFLRSSDPALLPEDSAVAPVLPQSLRRQSSSYSSPAKRQSRRNSSSVGEPMAHSSRYASDFIELGRLGKGGFGVVVKARGKIDGTVYAIKKIKQAPSLMGEAIREVMLLGRVQSSYVVRYYTAWTEDDVTGQVLEDSTAGTGSGSVVPTDEAGSVDFGYQSTGGLDFVSSAGPPGVVFEEDTDEETGSIDNFVQFADDSEDEDKDKDCDKAIAKAIAAAAANDDDIEDDEDTDDEDSVDDDPTDTNDVFEPAPPKPPLRKSRSDSHPAKSTLYIQMELCEGNTLRDLIRRTLPDDESWRILKQVTEGLAQIHAHNIIHRDLKPDNIFIDSKGDPKIGDFGLAKKGYQDILGQAKPTGAEGGDDLTKSVGTTLYVAPEIRSASETPYNAKADMYSLGIIFFEMCEPFGTAMERGSMLQAIRKKDHQLPAAFQSKGAKAAQGKVIMALISHDPSARPAAEELLRSDLIPFKIEDKAIREVINGLADPWSPYHHNMMSALFSDEFANNHKVKALAWDARPAGFVEDTYRIHLRSMAKNALEAVFSRHGSEDIRRQTIFPRSPLYTDANIARLVDPAGNDLMLRYDLILPYARQLAKHRTDVRCSYTIANSYRRGANGGPPGVSEEVDFDIVDQGDGDEKLTNNAEVLKVLDEAVHEMPFLATNSTVSLHINDCRILDSVLDHCRVPTVQQAAVKEILSKHGVNQQTWTKTRSELRKFGLSDTMLKELEKFDLREVPDQAAGQLRSLLGKATPKVRSRFDSGLRSVLEVAKLCSAFGVRGKLYLSPLGSVNAKLYEDNFLFQCILERHSHQEVIAAGGRYDSLILALRGFDSDFVLPGAVGVAIGMDPIIRIIANSKPKKITNAKKKQRREEPMQKRCDVLVLAEGNETIRGHGIKLATALWDAKVNAEFLIHKPEVTKDYNFVVAIRHQASTTVRVTNASSEAARTDDVPTTEVVGYLKQELRELELNRLRQLDQLRQSSQVETGRSEVQVLMARHGSKKSNRDQIVNNAQKRWLQKIDDLKNAPILAVELKEDHVLEVIEQTRLSDAESWRKVIQSVQVSEGQYVQQIQDKLEAWRLKWKEGKGAREVCVCNFRTEQSIYYDLAK